MEQTLTLEKLPTEFSRLSKTVDNIEQLLIALTKKPQPESDTWLDFDELCNYMPGKPAKPTLYPKLSKGEIPGHKIGKKWFFLKSEIDMYLRAGRKKTVVEINAEVDNCLLNKRQR